MRMIINNARKNILTRTIITLFDIVPKSKILNNKNNKKHKTPVPDINVTIAMNNKKISIDDALMHCNFSTKYNNTNIANDPFLPGENKMRTTDMPLYILNRDGNATTIK